MIKQSVLLFLFLTVYLTPVIGQEAINQFDTQGLRDGVWKKTFENTDQLRYEGKFDHGQEVGLFKFYKLDGAKSVLSATREFIPNSNKIEVKFYSSKGKLISEGQMVGKLFVGEWLYYHNKTKDIMTVEHYNKNGQLEGEKIVYYPNGQKAELSYYVNGNLEGSSQVFSEQGVLIKDFTYKNGALHGVSKYYNGDGELIAEGTYKDAQKHGIWKYYENGVLTEEKDFTVYSKNPGKQ